MSETAKSPGPGIKPDRNRLLQVDSLRAVAALLVVWTHASSSFPIDSPHNPAWLNFLSWLPEWLNMGRIGVSTFFIISGFVIFGSLAGKDAGAGRRFVIRRFFRLYPLFWLSIAVILIMFQGTFSGLALLKVAVANATMLPSLFGQPWLLGLYWTLEVELVFYLLCYLLFRAGVLEKFRIILALSLGLCVLFYGLEALAGRHLLPAWLPEQWWKMPRHLSVMFWGACLRWLYERTNHPAARSGIRTEIRGFGIVTVLLLAIPMLSLFHWLWQNPGTTPPPAIAYPITFILALIWICLWRPAPAWLVWLGVISYSIYLFHPILFTPLAQIVRHFGFWTTCPLWLFLLGVLVANTLLGSLLYLAVERPFIQLSHRLTRRKPN